TRRGGGTGTTGQALNPGIVVEMSRYMTGSLDIKVAEGWVKVESGVVKDQLNSWMKPYRYIFSPELSTSKRATRGGRSNTGASGQGG
ncbi:FAD-binding protein, partial [Erwinia amylovora]|uniref:FAD-binding protein n=1 Tax=Erwinia amylovora TaxID=552 RepID=UPI0020C0FBAC